MIGFFFQDMKKVSHDEQMFNKFIDKKFIIQLRRKQISGSKGRRYTISIQLNFVFLKETECKTIKNILEIKEAAAQTLFF